MSTASIPAESEPDYIICDGWAVMGAQAKQRQHAVTITVDEHGVEWAEFMCGAGNAVKYAKKPPGGKRVLRALGQLHLYNRYGFIEDRTVCEQDWCQKRLKDFLEHSDEYKARRAEEDAAIAASMPLVRERLVRLERRLARL